MTLDITNTTPERLSDAGKALMADRYFVGDEKTPEESLGRVVNAYGDDEAHAQRLFSYFTRCWAWPSTPVHSNGGTDRGQPISCFLNDVQDSREGLAEHYGENLWLSTVGGGVGSNWSSVRSKGTPTSKGNKTTGVIPFIKVVDSLTLASMQGSTRRGATAVYLSVSHPEIEEFIEIRKPTGDANRRSLNIHNAVSIPDTFMKAVTEGVSWDLIDPHTGIVMNTIQARDLWMKILTMRLSTGEPYLFFEDTANRALPEFLKNKGLRIKSSNLCSEIMLPTNAERTAVCCLSSVNLEYFDEWKDDPLFIEDMLRMLDNVLDSFIENAPEWMHKAVNSAKNERSVGLGAMGFHLYLQKKGIPFEGPVASGQNRVIFKHIKDKSHEANLRLGSEKGEAPDAHGTGLRFSHTNAIAPNANISILCGNTSPSIEPFNANAFTQKTQSGVFLIKNKALEILLVEKYMLHPTMLEETWQSIIVNKGSVQHLSFMSSSDKEVFKTAMELDQEWIIDHAATRQPFIDQGQSVNLFLPPLTEKLTLHKLHKAAWEKGLKALYYVRSESLGRTETISNVPDGDVPKTPKVTLSIEETDELNSSVDWGNTSQDWAVPNNECLACEG